VVISIAKRLSSSSEFKNISWLVFDRVWRLSISLFVGVWLTRYLGPDNFGKINYVLAFVGIAGVISSLGMESFLIKELTYDSANKNDILSSAFLLRLAVALFVFIFLLILFFFTNEPRYNFLLFFILAPQLLSNPFGIVDYALQSDLKARVTVIFRNTFFLIVAALKIVSIVNRWSIYSIAVLMVLDVYLGDLSLFFYFLKKNQKFSPFKINKSYIKELSVKSVPFLMSNVAIVIYMKVDQILLGKLSSPLQVGYFTAATKITEIFYFVPLIITGSLFKLLIEAKKESRERYLKYSRIIFFSFLAASILISVVVSCFSSQIVVHLFGEKFVDSIGVLKTYNWCLVPIFCGVAFGQLLVIEDCQSIVLYKTIIGVALNILLNIVLIPKYGAFGAAIATIITQFISSIAANLFFTKSRILFFDYFMIRKTKYNLKFIQ
jgi:polysaccharide transporter, PST family